MRRFTQVFGTIACTLVLALACPAYAEQARAANATNIVHAAAVDDFVNTHLRQHNIPGAAVGIFHKGQALHLAGYGLANVEHQVPVHVHTVFQTGSIGKMFTAAAVMLMVEDGKLALDESIRHYLPQAPESWQAITVRQLLNHTAGMPDVELDLQNEYSDEQLLQAYFREPLAFTPGQRWDYSNTGYATLGILVTRVSGRHYGQVLKERVFEPLGMQSARIISDRDIVMHRAAGYEPNRAGELQNQEWVSASFNATGDGAMYMALSDYGPWLRAVAERRILSAQSWREVLRPAVLANGKTHPYGFGWKLDTGPDGQAVIGHAGGWQGFSTDLRRYEGDDLSIVVLTNSSKASASALLQGVAERIDARYVQKKP